MSYRSVLLTLYLVIIVAVAFISISLQNTRGENQINSMVGMCTNDKCTLVTNSTSNQTVMDDDLGEIKSQLSDLKSSIETKIPDPKSLVP